MMWDGEKKKKKKLVIQCRVVYRRGGRKQDSTEDWSQKH